MKKKIQNIIKKIFQAFTKNTEEQEHKDVTPARKLTEQEARALTARLTLITMLLLFICGYAVLFGVNGILANYLLSANLIGLANYIFFKSY